MSAGFDVASADVSGDMTDEVKGCSGLADDDNVPGAHAAELPVVWMPDVEHGERFSDSFRSDFIDGYAVNVEFELVNF